MGKSLKHHVALQPLAIIMVGGMAFVAAYIGRLASKTTDVNWTKAKDLGDHMGYYKARQFQWFNPSGKDYEKVAADRVARGRLTTGRSDFGLGNSSIVGLSSRRSKPTISQSNG